MTHDKKSKMPGLVMPGDRDSEIRPFPVPHPGSGEVRLWVKAAELCESDLHFEAVVTQRRALEDGPAAVRDFDRGAAGKFIFQTG